MPTFVLQCQECKHEWDEFLKSYNNHNPPCPKCDSKNVERLPTTPSAVKVVDGHKYSLDRGI